MTPETPRPSDTQSRLSRNIEGVLWHNTESVLSHDTESVLSHDTESVLSHDTESVLLHNGASRPNRSSKGETTLRAQDHTIWGFRPPEETTRIAVLVTFLRQETAAPAGPIDLPAHTSFVRATQPTVGFYRYLYDTVGAPYVWWLRRTMPEAQLAALLGSPGVSLHVLYRHAEPAGFFELDARAVHTGNISYFGLLPHAVGQGMGNTLLRLAMATAWAHKPRALTVNTCTADHPRALPNYLRAGFTPVRTAREIWDVPNRLGLVIPDHLRV